MALPLPNALSDLPGGAIPNVMNAHTTFANNNHLREINRVKAQYAPLTTQAEAASKIAYANFMAPQFIAKIMQNPGFMANLNDDQKNILKDLIYNSGSGANNNSGLNALTQLQSGNQGGQQPNSLSGMFVDKLKDMFGMNHQKINPQLESTAQQIAHVESGGSRNPYSLIGRDTGKGDHALGKYQIMASNVPSWTKEALGKSMTPQEFLSSPEAQEKVANYMINKNLNAGNSSEDVGSIWFSGRDRAHAGNARDVNGVNVNQYVDRMHQAPNQNASHSWDENAARSAEIQAEGPEKAKVRVQGQNELDQQYEQALNLKTPIDEVGQLIANPKFQNLKNLPGFNEMQLNAKGVIGNKEEQKLVGQWRQAARAIVANTVKGFGGRILASEIPLAESMKLADSDSNGVLIGKWPGIKAFNEMTMKRARKAAQLMEKYHISKGAALEQADKMVDGTAIRREAERLMEPMNLKLNPLTHKDIETMMKNHNISREEVLKRLKEKGHL